MFFHCERSEIATALLTVTRRLACLICELALMKSYLLIALLLVVLSGCGSSAVDQMSSGEQPMPPWEALSAFEESPLRLVGYPREEQNWAKVKQALTSAEFQSGLSAFEQSPLPAEYSNKQAEKDTVVKAFHAAADAAKAGSENDMKAKLDEAFTAFPSLQSR